MKKEKEPIGIQEADILTCLYREPYVSQRLLSEKTGHSLGVVNRCLRTLWEAGYLDDMTQLTPEARRLFSETAPRNAIILAAGFGMRMVPINLTAPKALLEVNGERLIDRLILQLKEAGIRDITVVVGFMKESLEYLMDMYGVDLVVNEEYAVRNNMASLGRVLDRLGNTYVVPCDIWCDHNPFRAQELYSWYMVSDLVDPDSAVRVNRKMELVRVPEEEAGNAMIGIAYLLEEDAGKVREDIRRMLADGRHDDSFWEDALYGKDRMRVRARVVHSTDVVEINTYEQLRELDADSRQLKSDAIRTIGRVLECREEEIQEISVLKKGMTNRSFLFSVRGRQYIMRIPGEGTDALINRAQEAEVYRTIRGLGLCDDPVFMDPCSGFKITRYLDGVRTCDPLKEEDLVRCMEKLRGFHEMHLKTDHAFDLFGQIDFYERLRGGQPSAYRDYGETYGKVMQLKAWLDTLPRDFCLTHIDAVPDNFLFYPGENGEELQLTDWEYSGMQDPHVDLAMFSIYSLYDRKQADHLMDLYFRGSCPPRTRAKIYAYMAVCGLLWSNWCEYKHTLGVEFGAYSLRQYRYAKDFWRCAMEAEEGPGKCTL